jgi:hypothetical protein
VKKVASNDKVSMRIGYTRGQIMKKRNYGKLLGGIATSLPRYLTIEVEIVEINDNEDQ